jgi:hypothetical protein
MPAVEGGCLCGAIRYKADRPTKSMTCHCTTCRRSAGAPIVAWVTCPIRDFAWTRSIPVAHRSSPPVERGEGDSNSVRAIARNRFAPMIGWR